MIIFAGIVGLVIGAAFGFITGAVMASNRDHVPWKCEIRPNCEHSNPDECPLCSH